MIRVVFDTNILVSGLLYKGKPKKLIDLALDGKIELVTSVDIINEFRLVIARDKFKLTKEEQETFLGFIIRLTSIITIKSGFKVIQEDPDDDKIVRTAYDSKASYIVSGDHHLLKMKEFSGIRIVTANKMLEILNKLEN